MRSIAVINQKGGVGKTTSSVNLAAALAESGRRVCLMDLDPQAHASLHLGITAHDGEPSMYEVLCGDTSLEQARREVSDRISVVPSNLDLAAAELELAGEVGREMILRDKMEADDESFDYLVLDCPPSLGVLDGQRLGGRERSVLAPATSFPGLARPEQTAPHRGSRIASSQQRPASVWRHALHVRLQYAIGSRGEHRHRRILSSEQRWPRFLL